MSGTGKGLAGPERIVGTGEMAGRIRDFAWEKTPLGPLVDWPSTLVTTINAVLAMRYPVQVLWGPQMVLLYNDLWIPFYVDRHPAALGCPGAEFWAEAWSLVGEELDGVFRSGVATEHSEVLIPVQRYGEIEDVWWDYTYNPVFGEDGRVAGVVNISKDVTQQRQAEQERREAELALHQSQEELRRSNVALHAERGRLLSVLRQAPVFFALLEGEDHRFTMANELYEKLIGGRQVLGRTVKEVLPEVQEQGYLELLDSVLHTGMPFEGRGAALSISPGEGMPLEERLVDFVYQPLREADGSISGVIVLGIDITDSKKAEKALIQNEKLAAVGRLAASIAHEINNPLEAITNLLYLARGSTDLTEIGEYLDTADGELRRVSAIASQTLRFHKQATRAVHVRAEALVDSVLRIYAGRMANACVTLDQRLVADRPARCLEGEVRQVISNLVGNAIDAMAGRGGTLSIRSRNGRNWSTGEEGLLLTVADNGPGMSAATIAKIFEPFFTTKGIGGTGLGLWISTEIVRRHAGALRVRSSQGRAHGTAFRLFLPFGDGPGRADAPASLQAGDAAGAAGVYPQPAAPGR